MDSSIQKSPTAAMLGRITNTFINKHTIDELGNGKWKMRK